jgi:hypothetical protein
VVVQFVFMSFGEAAGKKLVDMHINFLGAKGAVWRSRSVNIGKWSSLRQRRMGDGVGIIGETVG